MNLRRSLVSMINLNLHVYADLKTKGGSQSILGDDAEQIKQVFELYWTDNIQTL